MVATAIELQINILHIKTLELLDTSSPGDSLVEGVIFSVTAVADGEMSVFPGLVLLDGTVTGSEVSIVEELVIPDPVPVRSKLITPFPSLDPVIATPPSTLK